MKLYSFACITNFRYLAIALFVCNTDSKLHWCFPLRALLTDGNSICRYAMWQYRYKVSCTIGLRCMKCATAMQLSVLECNTGLWSLWYYFSVVINSLNNNYYSFKIFPCFWLVKTACIIHHNQLLFTKFGKNSRHIESMMSKVQSAENYWTVDRENLGTRLCFFDEQNSKTPLRTGKYFEWIIKHLLNSAFIGCEEFCRSRRVLSTSAFGLCG